MTREDTINGVLSRALRMATASLPTSSLPTGVYQDEVFEDKAPPFISLVFNDETRYHHTEPGQPIPITCDCRITAWGTSGDQVALIRNKVIAIFESQEPESLLMLERVRALCTSQVIKTQAGLRYKDGSTVVTWSSLWNLRYTGY